jgi:hypothetical protein
MTRMIWTPWPGPATPGASGPLRPKGRRGHSVRSTSEALRAINRTGRHSTLRGPRRLRPYAASTYPATAIWLRPRMLSATSFASDIAGGVRRFGSSIALALKGL